MIRFIKEKLGSNKQQINVNNSPLPPAYIDFLFRVQICKSTNHIHTKFYIDKSHEEYTFLLAIILHVHLSLTRKVIPSSAKIRGLEFIFPHPPPSVPNQLRICSTVAMTGVAPVLHGFGYLSNCGSV